MKKYYLRIHKDHALTELYVVNEKVTHITIAADHFVIYPSHSFYERPY